MSKFSPVNFELSLRSLFLPLFLPLFHPSSSPSSYHHLPSSFFSCYFTPFTSLLSVSVLSTCSVKDPGNYAWELCSFALFLILHRTPRVFYPVEASYELRILSKETIIYKWLSYFGSRQLLIKCCFLSYLVSSKPWQVDNNLPSLSPVAYPLLPNIWRLIYKSPGLCLSCPTVLLYMSLFIRVNYVLVFFLFSFLAPCLTKTCDSC